MKTKTNRKIAAACMLLAMGLTVVAAKSPVAGLHPISAIANTGDDITGRIVIEEGVDEKGVMGMNAGDLDSTYKNDDFVVVDTFDCYYVDADGNKAALPYDHVTIQASYQSDENDAVIVLHYADGKWQAVGEAISTSVVEFNVESLSPFAIAKKSAHSSAQTGDFASVAVLGGSAICAFGGVVALNNARKSGKDEA